MRTHARVVLLSFVFLLVFPFAARSQDAVDETTRLAALCKVWGLIKYYHPEMANRTDWDETLLAAIPKVRASADRRELNKQLVDVINDAGISYVFRGSLYSVGRDGAALGTPFAWIDEPVFEPEMRLLLKAIVWTHEPAFNRYVHPSDNAGQADFSEEIPREPGNSFPDERTRLLALFRYWNMVNYFFPYRDLTDRPWPDVLTDMIPRVLGAKNDVEYHLAMAETAARTDDTHSVTYSSVLTAYRGINQVGIDLVLVENQTVITRLYPRLLNPSADLRVGDVVTHINGVPVETRRAALRPQQAGSNDAARERNIHRALTATNDARVQLTVLHSDGRPTVVEANTVSTADYNAEQKAAAPDVSSILPGNIGYVNMGRLLVSDVDRVMRQLKNTRGIVFDSRNYPNSTLYALANYLHRSSTPFVKFSHPDFRKPGKFYFTAVTTAGPGSGTPMPEDAFTYQGRIAILVNEVTISQAEFTVMALRTVPGAIVVGSQTAGADGNVVFGIRLPGEIYTGFSGLGVYYPDGRPTQRIGIVPDVVAKPTINGLRAGRDELLERAIELLR